MSTNKRTKVFSLLLASALVFVVFPSASKADQTVPSNPPTSINAVTPNNLDWQTTANPNNQNLRGLQNYFPGGNNLPGDWNRGYYNNPNLGSYYFPGNYNRGNYYSSGYNRPGQNWGNYYSPGYNGYNRPGQNWGNYYTPGLNSGNYRNQLYNPGTYYRR